MFFFSKHLHQTSAISKHLTSLSGTTNSDEPNRGSQDQGPISDMENQDTGNMNTNLPVNFPQPAVREKNKELKDGYIFSLF